MATPTICIVVGISRKIIAANAMVNSAWLCTMTEPRPTGMPCAMAWACDRNWPRNSAPLTAIRIGQDTAGLRKNRQGSAAIENRSAVINSGERSLSARRLPIKPNPQMTATRIAMQISAGFICWLCYSALSLDVLFSALVAGFGFAQEVGGVEGGVIVGRHRL